MEYSSYKRWKMRLKNHAPVIEPPGPKKVLPLNTGQLEQEIRELSHSRKRSHGATELYQSYRQSISRRDFAAMVSMARHDAYTEHRNNLRRVQWKVPGLVWSMDGTEWGYDNFGRKLHLHNLMDMASGYKFSSIAGEYACGEEIAGHLSWHYGRYGAPLFQKRDNGGNMLHGSVEETLDEFTVLPLNSPVYYPQYNGSMEAAQKEYQAAIRRRLSPLDICPTGHFEAYAEAAVNELNHMPRKALGNQNSCRRFFEGKNRVKFNKRERRSIYDWILDKTNDILVKMEDHTNQTMQAAYRIAAETWLRMKGFILVSIGRKVLPNFS